MMSINPTTYGCILIRPYKRTRTPLLNVLSVLIIIRPIISFSRDYRKSHHTETGYRGVSKGAYSAIVVWGVVGKSRDIAR